MKSVVLKSIYAGLGLLSTGKESVEEIGRKLAKKASLSEKDGERIARELRSRSEKAVSSLQKTLEMEVNKVVHALHSATGSGKSGAKRRRRNPRPMPPLPPSGEEERFLNRRTKPEKGDPRICTNFIRIEREIKPKWP